MAFNSRVMQQAIKEQMRGKVPDLNRIKREQQEAERLGKLSCRWDKDNKGKLCYAVYALALNGREISVHRFYNVSNVQVNVISNRINFYSRTHRVILSQLSRTQNRGIIDRVKRDLDELVNFNER